MIIIITTINIIIIIIIIIMIYVYILRKNNLRSFYSNNMINTIIF